jgi:hypothetical protein
MALRVSEHALQMRDPFTPELVSVVRKATPADVDDAYRAAADAQRAWAATPRAMGTTNSQYTSRSQRPATSAAQHRRTTRGRWDRADYADALRTPYGSLVRDCMKLVGP